MTDSPITGAPMTDATWIDKALNTDFEQHRVTSDGCEISVRRRRAKGPVKQSVLFVHGFVAQARWWDATISMLPDDWDCVAMTYTGMGASGWREKYSVAQDIKDTLTVKDWADFQTPPMLVGHSLGGGISTRLWNDHASDFQQFVILDSSLRFEPAKTPQYLSINRRFYDSKETAVGRFRFIPEQPIVHPAYVRYLAEHSVRYFDKGQDGKHWSWVFDFGRVEALYERSAFWYETFEVFKTFDPLPTFIRGAQSAICTDAWADAYQQRLGERAKLISIDGAYHHVLLDRPQELAATIQGLV